MADARFYLKTANDKKPSVILLKYHRGQSRIQFSTGLSIEPKHWSARTQRARKSLAGYADMNGALDRIAQTVEALVNECIATGQPVTNDSIRSKFHAAIGKQRTVKQMTPDVIETLGRYIETERLKLSVNYLKSVGTLHTHLGRFEKATGKRLSFEKIDLGFYNDFTSYLLSLGHSNNTVAINVSRLKRFLQWCSDAGHYTLNFHTHKKFKAKEDEGDTIALTEPELMALLHLDLEPGTTACDVRDLFCLAAFTGLRFSDASAIQREHVQQDATGDWWLKKWIEKTKTYHEMPLSDPALVILNRHQFKFKSISLQKTNDYLKELGQQAGINEQTLKTIYRGATKDERTEPKFKLLSFHCARRTFATLSLEKGMRPEVVMKLTGHRTLKSFMKYVKVSPNVLKLEMHKAWSKPEEQALKVLTA